MNEMRYLLELLEVIHTCNDTQGFIVVKISFSDILSRCSGVLLRGCCTTLTINALHFRVNLIIEI